MTLAPAALAEEADRLFRALRERTPVSPPRERLPGLTVRDAYAIQRRLVDLRAAAGAQRIGRKVGLTSAPMQQLLGVHEPDYGVLLDDMLVDTAEGIRADTLIAPRAEPEIAFVLGAPLAGDVGPDDVLAATAAVCAAIEVVDSRVADWRIGIEDTVADNASSALLVLGERRPPDALDLAAEPVRFQVRDDVETGRGDAVLGHPATAVAWLARTLQTYGEGLAAGDVVLPGAMTKALPIAAGDLVRASFGTLGELEVAVR